MKKLRSPFGCASRCTAGYPNYSGGAYHGGEDYVPVEKTPESNWDIYAVSAGSVYIAKKQKGDYAGGYGAYGNYIVYICDNGLWVLCAHLAKLPRVKAGERLAAGELIGVAGATGNVTGRHLHIEVADMRGVEYGRADWYSVFKARRVRPSDYIDFGDYRGDDFFVKIWKNGTTVERVYQTTEDCKARRRSIGSLAPYESCECRGVIDGVYLVVYRVDGTDSQKCGFVRYSGGVK